MKKLVMGLAVCCSVLLMGQSALAVGLGGGIWLGGGSGTLEVDTVDVDLHDETRGIGFLLDTRPLSGSVFSYRLQVGYERKVFTDEVDDTINVSGISIDNTFAFAFVRNSKIRFWAGPLVHVGYQEGQSDIAGSDDFDIWLTSFAVGPEVGLNFAFSRGFLGSVNLGFKFVGLAGEAEMYGNTEDVEGNETVAYLKFNLMGNTGRE